MLTSTKKKVQGGFHVLERRLPKAWNRLGNTWPVLKRECAWWEGR